MAEHRAKVYRQPVSWALDPVRPWQGLVPCEDDGDGVTLASVGIFATQSEAFDAVCRRLAIRATYG